MRLEEERERQDRRIREQERLLDERIAAKRDAGGGGVCVSLDGHVHKR
jgi:hypothetical protein